MNNLKIVCTVCAASTQRYYMVEVVGVNPYAEFFLTQIANAFES